MIIKFKECIKFIIKSLAIRLIIIINYFKFNIKKIKLKPAEKKNILIIVSRLHTGGAEKAAINIAEELYKKYPVKILIYEDRKQKEYECNVPIIEATKHKQAWFKLFSLIREVRKIKKENQITHTISFCTRANLVNVASKYTDKTIISVRNYLSNSGETKMYKKYNKISCKLADRITAVSTLVKEDLIKNYGAKEEKITTIFNFIEEEKINKYSKEKVNVPEDYVITIGRLCKQKAQWHLIKAFKIVTNKIPEAKLLILGQGEFKEKLEELIKKLNLEKNITLLGFKKNPYAYLKNAKLFVLISYFEGMSNSILEAMVCGVPIIATDCKAGNREILAPNTDFNKYTTQIEEADYGILVPVCNKEAESFTEEEKQVADAIIEMLRNSKLRNKYSEKAKERVKYFSKEKSMQKWISVIE